MRLNTDLISRVLERALDIQRIPAPTFHEAQRAAFVRQCWEEEGVAVEQAPVGNVYAHLPGRGDAPPVIVTAHLDTVFPAGTDLTVRREGPRWYGPGLGDNSLGVAALFGVYWALRSLFPLPGDLWLVADVAEEGLGNLRGIRAVVERFGGAVSAYLVLEGLGLGHVYHRALGVRRYRVTLRTPGGHSWADAGQPSAIHELAALITEITRLPLPARPRTTLNVGRIGGGVSINTIAPEAWMEIDLRSEEARALGRVASAVERLAQKRHRAHVEVYLEVIGERPAGALPPEHPLVQTAEAALRAQGVTPTRLIGSTDANIPLSRGYPAVGLGLARGGGAHSDREYIEPDSLPRGLAAVVALVRRAYSLARR
ncbi:MAG TPA: M20/M25/M40 family metallo-hydrolase [Anaerolineae bacterium]|nr:M20/M25/M40 family metallo-hydrolase [Anaerolineae bacterium]HID84032.1 M20/M25/M40 family metallo-hydrolase [Anaerolineales bacterium]HIQ08021.1 M20/M25/M40 family metallo-hydrolase [Anaerolineaceae bacterium]